MCNIVDDIYYEMCIIANEIYAHNNNTSHRV